MMLGAKVSVGTNNDLERNMNRYYEGFARVPSGAETPRLSRSPFCHRLARQSANLWRKTAGSVWAVQLLQLRQLLPDLIPIFRMRS